MLLRQIAHIENDYTDKFGIPRQAGLADVPGRIVFEPEFRREEAFRGLEGFEYIWLVWGFSEPFARPGEGGVESPEERRPDEGRANGMDGCPPGGPNENRPEGGEESGRGWSPTVRPPRLGGNRRMGVFATRSPNRPNPIGLSAVALERVAMDRALGPVLYVRGADLQNGSPIYDIKPYIPSADSHESARAGFSNENEDYTLSVVFPEPLLSILPEEKRKGLLEALKEDPRPAYKDEAERVYGLSFGGYNIRFRVAEKTLTVLSVEPDARERAGSR